MGQQLTPEQVELYRRADEVLHYMWDPIGVAGTPEARDEYYAYLPQVFSLLIDGGDTEGIAEFLGVTVIERMGHPDTNSVREHARKIANILVNSRDFVKTHIGQV